MTTSVKLLSSSLRDAPVLSSAAGSLKALLSACLKSGFGSVTASLVSVTDGIATATVQSGSSFESRRIVQVSGATPTALNGDHEVLPGATLTQVQWVTSAPDGDATGSITIKYAPAGWQELFSATNVVVLQSASVNASGCCLRVDDTGTTSARVIGYGAMTAIDAGTAPFPTPGQQAGGLYWPKAHNATGSRKWALVADDRTFYLYVQPTTDNVAGSLVGFGDLIVDEAANPWDCFLAGHTSAVFTGGAGCLSAVGSAPTAALALPKPASGVGDATLAYLLSAFRTAGVSGNGVGSQLPVWPNVAHGDTILTDVYLIATDGLRGRLPGLRHTPASITWSTAFDTEAFPGHLVMRTNPGAAGVALVDFAKEWR
ncbi:hypothetical protein [Ottowia sp. VDI28]|uniref:hypothetical protein n=1 Tax=Ottowia sp. VDI28 TaxID=3133968 RepID=UPI003C2E5C87